MQQKCNIIVYNICDMVWKNTIILYCICIYKYYVSSLMVVYTYLILILDLWKPVLSPMTADLIFLHKRKTSWTHYQISQSYPGLSGLLLLVAFPKPTGDFMSSLGP